MSDNQQFGKRSEREKAQIKKNEEAILFWKKDAPYAGTNTPEKEEEWLSTDEEDTTFTKEPPS